MADLAESRKLKKYESLVNSNIFIPVACETLGGWGSLAAKFIKSLGDIIREETQNARATEYLKQRLSMAVQRGNAISVLAHIPKRFD